MFKDIKRWVRECHGCQKAKIQRHTKSPIGSFPPAGRFEAIHVDIVGPLSPCRIDSKNSETYYRYILTCVDRATRWLEAFPIPDVSASIVARTFFEGWICRFGVPLFIITDRGKQFEAEIFQHLSKLVGFHRIRTTAYNPKANGMVERSHRVLKTAIKAAGDPNWLALLPAVLMGIRMTPNVNGISPFTAVTGSDMMLPLKFEPSSFRNNSEIGSDYIDLLRKFFDKIDFHDLSMGHHHVSEKSFIPKELSTCRRVWIRLDRVTAPLEAPYIGPAEVLERHGKSFSVRLPTGKLEEVSVDRLKPVMDQLPESKREHIAEGYSQNGEDSIKSSVLKENEAVVKRTKSGRRVIFKKDPDVVYF